MIDDIGLGNFLANAVYVWLAAVAIIVFIILFFFLKKRGWSFWFLSLMVNFIFFLYILGSRVEWYKYIAIIIWPIINLIWLILLIKNKKRK